MKVLHERGARNETTCVAYGMPREALRLGAVDAGIALEDVSPAVLQFDARG